MADIFSDAYQFGRDYGLDQSDIMKQAPAEYARNSLYNSLRYSGSTWKCTAMNNAILKSAEITEKAV